MIRNDDLLSRWGDPRINPRVGANQVLIANLKGYRKVNKSVLIFDNIFLVLKVDGSFGAKICRKYYPITALARGSKRVK
jgi:hypothetical protein